MARSSTSFAKGKPNPGRGRPPAGKGLTEHLRMALMRKNPFDAAGRTYRESFIEKTLTLAMTGNAAALKEIWERIDGKVPQPIEGNPDKPVAVVLKFAGTTPEWVKNSK